MFMSTHGISASIISLANPWLDFLPSHEALSVARTVNDDFEEICKESKGRIYAFAILPLSAPLEDIVSEIRRLGSLHHIRGIILGTTGLGSGLDDPKLAVVWSELEKSQMLVFLHPHYGLPIEVYGPRSWESGLVLPLSLGFPMETTIGFVRMWISGVFDQHTKLKILMAHAGGTVPFLAGRVESCVEHERRLRDESGNQKERRSIVDVLKTNVWLDAVTYSEIGTRASIETVGIDRVLFGTDHPFFPPLDKSAKEWVSVRTNITAVEKASGTDDQAISAVLGRNAINLLKLDLP